MQVTDFLQVVSALKEQLNPNLSRSDVLRPLAWFVGILATVTTASFFAPKTPGWFSVALALFLGAGVTVYCAAYVFCLLNDRDALRSEKYSLHKMAIQQGLYGDSLSGVLPGGPKVSDVESVSSTIAIGSDNG